MSIASPIEKSWERCYGKFTFAKLPNREIVISPIIHLYSNFA